MLVFPVMGVAGVLVDFLCKSPLVAEEFEVAEMSCGAGQRWPRRTENHWGALRLTHLSPSFFLGSPPSIRASRGWCTPAPSFHSTFRDSPSWICPRGAAAATASVPPARLQPTAFTSRLVGWPAHSCMGDCAMGLYQRDTQGSPVLLVGFLPPGPPPPITPPVSVPHTPAVNIPNCKCWILWKAGILQGLLAGVQCVFALFLSYSNWWEWGHYQGVICRKSHPNSSFWRQRECWKYWHFQNLWHCSTSCSTYQCPCSRHPGCSTPR